MQSAGKSLETKEKGTKSLPTIRITVRCSDLVKQIIFAEYKASVVKTDTLQQHTLNLDLTTFIYSHRPKELKDHYNSSIKVLLNCRQSKVYRPGRTERAFEIAIEKRAYEILHSRMLGAYYYSQSPAKAIECVLNQLNILEAEYMVDTIRKQFYRYRLAREIA